MFSVTNLMNKASSFLNKATAFNKQIREIINKTPPIILDGIHLELVSQINESYSNNVPIIPIDDGSQISDNISSEPLRLSFKVQIVGNNHKEIFARIKEMKDKRELVDLYMIELYENLAITSIENTISSLYYTEFTISFVQIQVAYIGMIPSPSPKAKPAVSRKTKIKTVGKATKNKEWEGDLASESIKLPGE